LKLTFGVCRYFDYLNTTEILAHEWAAGEIREVCQAAGIGSETSIAVTPDRGSAR
jgi:hypothetical protein